MHAKRIIALLSMCFLASALAFLLWNVSSANLLYHLPRRAVKLAALCMTGSAIALSTLMFQTVTANNILTPSILGLDSLYLLIQSMIVFLFGSKQLALMQRHSEYLLSVALMVLFSLGLFSLLLGKRNFGLSVILLLGMMFGQLFGGLASFIQILIDPNEFLTVQARLFASFNSVNTSLLLVSSLLFGLVFLVVLPHLDTLDVLSLGRDTAINLGIDYSGKSRLFLILVAILTSVATALVGPVTFLGLLVVNIAKQLAKTYRHRLLLPISCLLSMTSLVLGQLLVERIFQFNTPISVIINFLGGLYFLSLLISRGKA